MAVATRLEAMGLQTLRDWVGPSMTKAPCNPSILNEAQRQALAERVEAGPVPAIHGIVRWRLVDLAQGLCEEFRVSISKQTLSRELRAMGFRKLSARPRHHAQDAEAPETFKKTSPPAWTRSRPMKRQASP
ncbi:helix-turn-helix domain-containing protein [Pararhodospirillum photometricum]|uniref:helix-turn-helix domain-containing protein n=1 Tax=Pararhodospirillum photometricum TaxID=1084 RepID=UPI0002E684A4